MSCLTETMKGAIGEIGIVVKMAIVKEITMTVKVVTVENMEAVTATIESLHRVFAHIPVCSSIVGDHVRCLISSE